jgi:hypothetical protein
MLFWYYLVAAKCYKILLAINHIQEHSNKLFGIAFLLNKFSRKQHSHNTCNLDSCITNQLSNICPVITDTIIVIFMVNTSHVGFVALSEMKSSLFWDIRPCSQLKANQRLSGICRLHLQGWRISQARNQHEGSSNQSRALFAVCFNPASSNLEGAGQNVSWLSKDFTVPCPRTQDSSIFHIFSLTLLLWFVEDKNTHRFQCHVAKRDAEFIHVH